MQKVFPPPPPQTKEQIHINLVWHFLWLPHWVLGGDTNVWHWFYFVLNWTACWFFWRVVDTLFGHCFPAVKWKKWLNSYVYCRSLKLTHVYCLVILQTSCTHRINIPKCRSWFANFWTDMRQLKLLKKPNVDAWFYKPLLYYFPKFSIDHWMIKSV